MYPIPLGTSDLGYPSGIGAVADPFLDSPFGLAWSCFVVAPLPPSCFLLLPAHFHPRSLDDGAGWSGCAPDVMAAWDGRSSALGFLALGSWALGSLALGLLGSWLLALGLLARWLVGSWALGRRNPSSSPGRPPGNSVKWGGSSNQFMLGLLLGTIGCRHGGAKHRIESIVLNSFTLVSKFRV